MRTPLPLAAVLAAALAAPALADGPDVAVHGFGSWAAGYTDRNVYTTGSPGGRWDDASFALQITARPEERLTIAAQAFFAGGGERGEQVGRLDWAFAGWRFSDAVTLRVGKVKQPFGLYGEIFDVGTLRPFQTLPQGIYGPADFVGEAYLGAGLTGSFFSDRGWGLSYDVFVGELIVTEAELPALVAHPDRFPAGDTLEIEDESHGRQLGGRLTLHTPVDGLIFRVTAAGRSRDLHVEGLSAEWLTDEWSVRSEIFHQRDAGEELEALAGYLEVARRLGPHLQLAARLDASRTWLDAASDPAALLRHRDLALGVNWWFSPQLVLRAAVHDVDGNRFAAPADVVDALPAGRLRRHTVLGELGAQFSF